MIKMHGSSRVLDSAIVETGTSAARQISLYGITSLAELADKPLLVKSANDGVANTTIQINNLTAKSLKVMKNNVTVDTYANWITAGQLYFLMYNGNVFTAFPVGISSSESSSSKVTIIPLAVTELSYRSTAQQILNAFGSADNELDLQEAIEYGANISPNIVFEGSETNVNNRTIHIIETRYEEVQHIDTIRFISALIGSYNLYTLQLTRDTTEGSSTPYIHASMDAFTFANTETTNNAILNITPRRRVITIETTDWVLNSTTNNYEYTLSSSRISSSTSVEISMDLTNQALMTDGYTESGAGKCKIITSTLPSAAITMTVKIQNTDTF